VLDLENKRRDFGHIAQSHGFLENLHKNNDNGVLGPVGVVMCSIPERDASLSEGQRPSRRRAVAFYRDSSPKLCPLDLPRSLFIKKSYYYHHFLFCFFFLCESCSHVDKLTTGNGTSIGRQGFYAYAMMRSVTGYFPFVAV